MRLFAERGTSDLAVSDIAEAAGVARGTIYNNIERPNELFGEVVSGLAHEMHERVSASMSGIDDPARRVAIGLRLFVRRAHDEPDWGRFLIRFALSETVLRKLIDEPPAHDIARGMESGRFKLRPSMTNAALHLLGGAALSAMYAVVSGEQTWREAGAETAELVLRALGVGTAEAKRIAGSELPPLLAPVTTRRPKKKEAP